MLTLPSADVELLAGTRAPSVEVRPPFDPLVCAFLSDVAKAVREDARARVHADLQSFAYWCRPAHLDMLAVAYKDGDLRLGRGLLFHIAPSNVPMNAAFSLAFGLLSGNTNLVRVSTKDAPQLRLLCAILDEVLSREDYVALRRAISVVRYPRDADFTAYASGLCQGRVIWGGDETIKAIRRHALPPRAVEVTFADRYSFCILRAAAVGDLNDAYLRCLVERFYNDCYTMDQNACSSPRAVFWLGRGSDQTRQRFWRALSEVVARRYELAAIQAVDKYTAVLEDVMAERAQTIDIYHSGLYVLPLADEMGLDASLRGRFGVFYEKEIEGLEDLLGVTDPIYQTITQFGFERAELQAALRQCRPLGIDRIVPVGKALDIGPVWDGYDLIRALSRIVEVA